MHNKDIQIPRKITNQLLHLAQITPEQEICGLIGAKNNIATTCYPVNNCADKPESLYQMDSQQQITAMATMRNNNEQLFAIYHSHPSTPAIPSSTDIKLANYPEAIHLIISLNTKGVLEIRGFTINNNAAEEVNLSLVS